MQRRQQYRESQEVAEDSLKKIIAAFPRAIAGAICLSDMAQGRPFITVLTDVSTPRLLTVFRHFHCPHSLLVINVVRFPPFHHH